ncbi:MAG: hydroxyethylthiazole kinase [Geminicoccaceae bacterium]
MTPEELYAKATDNLELIRSERPRVHVLTNFVAMNVSANVLLAAGAIPSMTIDETVIEEFVGSARSLVVNLGQLDPWRKISVPMAIAVANKLGRPWLLDPVKVDRSGRRLAFATLLMDLRPTVLRCNRGEVGTLEGAAGLVIAETGEVDHVTDGTRRIDIHNGSPLMARITAMGVRFPRSTAPSSRLTRIRSRPRPAPCWCSASPATLRPGRPVDPAPSSRI